MNIKEISIMLDDEHFKMLSELKTLHDKRYTSREDFDSYKQASKIFKNEIEYRKTMKVF